MKKKSRALTMVFAICIGLMGGTFAKADPGEGENRPFHDGHLRGGHRGRNPHIERLFQESEIAEKIGISEEQRQQVLKRLNAIHEEEKRLFKEQKKAAVKQATLLIDKNVDKQALFAAVEETGRIRTEIAKLRIEKIFIIRDVLTEEQQMKLRQSMHHRRGHDRNGLSEHRKPNRARLLDRLRTDNP